MTDYKHIYTVLNNSDVDVLQLVLVLSLTSSILPHTKAEHKPSGARSGPAVRRGTSSRFGPLQKANRFSVLVIGINSFQKKKKKDWLRISQLIRAADAVTETLRSFSEYRKLGKVKKTI
jgi:hypothetical protein